MCVGSTKPNTTASKFLGPVDTMLILTFLTDDPAPLESHTKVDHIQPFWPNVHCRIYSIADIKGPFSPDVIVTHRIPYALQEKRSGLSC